MDRQRDRQTDLTNLIVSFRNSANAPTNFWHTAPHITGFNKRRVIPVCPSGRSQEYRLPCVTVGCVSSSPRLNLLMTCFLLIFNHLYYMCWEASMPISYVTPCLSGLYNFLLRVVYYVRTHTQTLQAETYYACRIHRCDPF
jgi:hypothetical protein